MVLKFAFLSSLLLASVALASPTSRLAARLARRRENRQSQPLNRVDASSGGNSNIVPASSPNWAGCVLNEPAGTFTNICGTFTVPTLSGSNGSAAAAWVGIDGDTCQNAILQTGVDFTISDGGTTYDAWYEWYPDYAYDFSGITVSAGDEIQACVTAYSTTSGVAELENLTNGQSVSMDLSAFYALCEQDAEWVVEEFVEDGGPPPADFGTVTFTNCTASGPGGTYTCSDSNVVNIEYDREVLTSVTVSGSDITVKYK